MKSIKIWLVMTGLSLTMCTAQIRNARTETVTIQGNCGMCENTIEKAGNKNKVAKVDWNKDTQKATLTYDAEKTNADEILKRIALAGYDNEKYLAPDNVYAALPECCQYKRIGKASTINPGIEEHHTHHAQQPAPPVKDHPFNAVFAQYFELKDALVESDGKLASSRARKLFEAISSIDMKALLPEEHTAWMDLIHKLKPDTELIAKANDVSQQRDHFAALSVNMYQLLKATQTGSPVYYQYCPMYNNGKGAHWLSKEEAIHNPYYGAQMLTCGKTTETIK